MDTTVTTAAGGDLGRSSPRSSLRDTGAAFRAMLARDLTVLRKDLKNFVPDTIVQPLLLMFILTYVFPRIGQPVGRGYAADAFSTLTMAGLVAHASIMQGIYRVAIPMVRDLSMTRELEDRVLSPVPVSMVAAEKIVFGAMLSMFAALIVFPVSALIPATAVYLSFDWPVLITVAPLAFLASSALGLTIGTLFEPRSVPLLLQVIVMPITFGGAVFYTWGALDPMPWLQYPVLANPLVYMSEGFRAAIVSGVYHMSYPAIYAGLATLAIVLTATGIRGFKKRVLA